MKRESIIEKRIEKYKNQIKKYQNKEFGSLKPHEVVSELNRLRVLIKEIKWVLKY